MARKCGTCKQEGHTAPTCPMKQPVQPVQLSTQVPSEVIEIPDNSCALWGALASQDYDHFQPFVELIDNAIAAIISAVCQGRIYINFNFDSTTGSIEHSGGKTFPLDKTELIRVLTYGGVHATRLNEHGCGLKSSLAILDPTNRVWKIYFKFVENGLLKVKSISAPYSNKMSICDEPEWPGADKTAENGTYITFPVSKDRFVNMYQKKTPVMEDLHDRIKCHFTHMWMKLDEFIEGKLKMEYNSSPILPFSFGAEKVNEFVSSTKNTEFKLKSGAPVKVQHIMLSEKAPSRKGLPGSYKFKRAMCSNGAYLFKNGRFIESIHTDDAMRGNMYTSIFGSAPHNNHNGNIVLVNMIGNQDELPPTVPTKNRFQGSNLFDELIELLSTNIIKPEKSAEEKEAVLSEDYSTRIEKIYRRHFPTATFEREKSFPYSNGTSRTAPIDLVISYNKTRELIEFKKNIRPAKDDIGQLFMNWAIVKKLPENEEWELKPTLVYCAANTTENLIGDSIVNMLDILSEYGFNPEIRNTKDETLWPIGN
jgi:hypothetical protein